MRSFSRGHFLNIFFKKARTLILFKKNRLLSTSTTSNELLQTVRNLGISAHIDAGKTTCTERMLLFSGAIARAGEVHDGDTVTDYMIQERERGITIKAAAISFGWKNYMFNLIDTPGHVDFTMEVERSMRVLDGSILLFDAVNGVEAQSETVFTQAMRYDVAKIAFANKMDREGSSIDNVATSMKKRLGVEPLILHYSIGEAGSFVGVIDLISMDMIAYTDETGKNVWRKSLVDEDIVIKYKENGSITIPCRSDGNGPLSVRIRDLFDSALIEREKMLEKLANADDIFADIYLSSLESTSSSSSSFSFLQKNYSEDKDNSIESHSIELNRRKIQLYKGIKSEDIVKAIRRVVCSPKSLYIPLFAGSAYKNKGIQLLLDAACFYLPSPLDRQPLFGTRVNVNANGTISNGIGKRNSSHASKQHSPQKTLQKNEKSSSTISSTEKSSSSSSSLQLVPVSPNAPLCALAFKVQKSPTRGPLVFFRVYSGVLTKSQPLINVQSGEKERPSKLLQVMADDQREVESISCGFIGAATGLKNVKTGDTLCVSGDPNPLLLPSVSLPRPVFTASLEVGSSVEQKALDDALSVLLREDPSLHVNTDKDTGQTLLSGMGELHLDIACDRLNREYNVPVRLGKLMIAYRESAAISTTVNVVYDKTIGNKHMWAKIKLSVEPILPSPEEIAAGAVLSSLPCVFDTDNEDNNDGYMCNIVTGNEDNNSSSSSSDIKDESMLSLKPMPQNLADALRDSVIAALGRGPLFGYPLVGLRFCLISEGCEINLTTTTSAAIRACAAKAIDEAVKSAQALLLEPVMAVEVSVPEKYVGETLNDLSSTQRRGIIRSVEGSGGGSVGGGSRSGNTIIYASVPLKNMLGFSTSLRSKTGGDGSFSMELARYDHVGILTQKNVISNPTLL
jgi:elongation factor G